MMKSFLKYSVLSLAGILLLAFSPLSLADAASPLGTHENGIVAIVNNDVITTQELTIATTQMINQAKAQNLPVPDKTVIEQHVLQTLIMQKIALQLANLNKVTVSDKEVQNAISNIAQKNNLSVSGLYAKLAGQGINKKFYTNSIRTQIILQRLEQAEVAGSIIITPNQIDNYLAAQARVQNAGAEYNVANILIALPNNPTAADYTNTKAKAEAVLNRIKDGMNFALAAETYSASSNATSGGTLGYKTLSQLPTSFIEPVASMSIGEVTGPIATDGGFNIIKLVGKKGGSAHEAHYVKEYHVQSLLIKSSPLLTNAAVKAELMRIKLSLANGKSFAEEAKAYSEDYFTSQNGGDMGWINPTKLNPVLMSYVQSAKIDAVSPPIETEKGWYLIKVLGVRDVNNTHAYLRQQAQQALFEQKANEALLAWQAQIKSASYIKILDPALNINDEDDDSGS